MWIAPTPDRLGCDSNATGRLCALLKFRDDPESQCAQPLDSRLHTLTCKAGLARMRQHRAIATTLTNLLKQGGAEVDKERPAPHMYEFETNDKGERVVKEAILDLAVALHTLVCVRPWRRGKHQVEEKVAACATMGEEDKLKRYKCKALPMVMDTFGRLGPESEKVLNLLTTAAGQTTRARRVLHVCRNRLRRALWFASADAALQALGRAAAPAGHLLERACFRTS